MDADDAVEDAKARLRATVRAARRARPDTLRETAADGIRDVARTCPTLRRARVVTCYLNSPTEPGTGPLRTALAAAGVRVLLPVTGTTDDGEPLLDWAVDDGTHTTHPRHGFPESTGPRQGPGALATADVVLVPALAVDTLGHRLGQGGGYYDRALGLARIDVPVIAVLYDTELLDAAVETVPDLPHDRRVDAVLTPTRWVLLRR